MYDWEWCREVVEEFEAKHPSGCATLERLYSLPKEYAVRLLMFNTLRWRGYKSLAKHLEDSMELYRKGYTHSRDFGSNYYTFDKYLKRVLKRRLFPAPVDLLDAEIDCDQSSRAEKEGDVQTELTEFGRQFLFDLG